jgi:carbamoyltransferase
MNILGISGQDRNAAAALVHHGTVVAAIEEEKLLRIPTVGIGYAGGLPDRAIEFCLNRADIDIRDIDYVVYYMQPFRTFFRGFGMQNLRAISRPDSNSPIDVPSYFVDNLTSLRQHLKTTRKIRTMSPKPGRFLIIDHQVSHAAGAFFRSGFDRAAIAVAGNAGDWTSAALMTGEGTRLRVHARAKFPNSLGMVYTAVTDALGFGRGRENKTMWLAPTGENEFGGVFRDLLRVDRSGLPLVNQAYFKDFAKGTPAVSELFIRRTGLTHRREGTELTRVHRNIAASLQVRTAEVVCEIVARHMQRTGQENLCLAGGVALNSLANASVERCAEVKRIFIEPVAGNAGCSMGSALYVWHSLLGKNRVQQPGQHLFLGPRFNDEDIKICLDNCKVDYEYFPAEARLVEEVARLLAGGNIIAWFRGAMEFGPRALGARCILASPSTAIMGENLNKYIKHREDFRPFSAAVPEDRAAEFFVPSGLTQFLQGICKIRDEKSDLIPAVAFGDGIARVQTVSRKDNPPFWRLLARFGEISGVPILLSTSFNLFGEPLISSPREAIRGFYCSGIDCLAIGSFLIRK